ncbi:MAG: rhamnulose-1-phosphate aldolase [Desulfatiglans sp.]|nr:rhamnulose-1-phosphate aldolase [Desulfatiglans sp.]
MSRAKGYEDFGKSVFVEEMLDAARLMSERGWAERNAGNMSCIIPGSDVVRYFDPDHVKRVFPLGLNMKELSGMVILITAAGSYFRKLKIDPAKGMGAVRVSLDGNRLELLWGFESGASPTSEMHMHFMGHIKRLKKELNHRVILHTHATNTIIMSANGALDEKAFTRALWNMHSECVVVFPEGVGLVPWMVPGTQEISSATAEKLEDFRLIIWPLHGIIATGNSIDEAMGLIETVEKTAEIYIKSMGFADSLKLLTDKQVLDTAARFNLKPRQGILEL